MASRITSQSAQARLGQDPVVRYLLNVKAIKCNIHWVQKLKNIITEKEQRW